MSIITIIVIIFGTIGAIDCILGNKLGLGEEFERAFYLLGTLALSMIGMIVIAPVIADVAQPLSKLVNEVFHIDPSVIPASLLANDMGGASLSVEMANNEQIGMFMALVVSSMMGCTISFTIPFALGLVEKSKHSNLFLGLLCGIVTIPIGCFAGGLCANVPIKALVVNLLPLILFAVIIAIALIFVQDLCIKVFKVFGFIVKILIYFGLAIGIVKFLTGFEVIKGIATLEEGALICVNAAIVLSGAFPFMKVVSMLLSKPLKVVGKKTGLCETSVLGMLSGLVTSATTFGTMNKMNDKGVVLCSALCVSAAFTVGSHLAFTLSFNGDYIVPVIVGKLVAGFCAVVLASILYNNKSKKA